MDVEMAVHRHVPHVRSLRNWPTLGARATLSLSLVLFVAIFVLRVSDSNVGDAESTLFLMPIAALALRFGLRGALAGALVACALVVAWGGYDDVHLSVIGYLSRFTAFLVVGTLFGSFVDHRRRLEAEILRHSEASLDLLATADLSGNFTRVNPAWERTLGYSAETMCSQPYLEFVHPDDREATIAETAALARGSRDTVRFRNRYRAADGSYRWLEWSAHGSPSDGVIHAVARDVTVQHEAEQQLANNATLLETKVAERTRELDDAHNETLQRLAIAAEYRDDQTFQHTERVGASAAEIAGRLGLSSEQIKLLSEAAPLHDVGKLAIPDRILLKPGKLSAQEWEVMKTHTSLGARLLSGSSSPVLQMAAVIAENHHERWDGTGYPNGLAGEAIPLVGRVVAVADVFDALTHIRPYKSAWPVADALAEIQRAAGSHLDPRVVSAFLTMYKDAPAAAESAHPQRRRRPTGVPRKPRETQAIPQVPPSAQYV
jgi:PAS domain S-box-containing protein